MNCKYCFQGDKADLSSEFMSFETFKCIIDRIVFDYKLYGKTFQGKDPIQIQLHGGEPTLLPSKELDKYLEYAQKKLQFSKVPYELLIQTNGINLDQNYRKVLKKYNVQVGISLDGFTNDLRDTIVDKNIILNNVLCSIEEGLSVGTLSVITKHNIKVLPKEILSLPIPRVTKLTLVQNAYPDMDLEPCVEDIFNFIYKPNIDSFIETGQFKYFNEVKHYLERYLLNKLTIYRNFNKNTCHYKDCGACTQLITFFPDGSLRICDRINYKEKAFQVVGPNIRVKSFLDLDQLKMNLGFNDFMGKARLERGCDSCLYNNFCLRPCPSAYFYKYEKPHIPLSHCQLVKKTYNYIDNHLINILTAFKESKHFQGEIPFSEQYICKLRSQRILDLLHIPYALELLPQKNAIKIKDY